MKPIDFGDFYKFSASLGLALVIFAFVFPWLVLTEDFDFKLQKTQYEALSATVQQIVETRQKLATRLTESTPYISGISMILGLGLMAYGLLKWKKTQSLLDENQLLKNRKLLREVGLDAANALIGDFLAQFRQLSETQVSRFFMFLRLADEERAFQIPEAKNDPKRKNEIHEDLRHLREAFLLIANDPDDGASGRFKYPREVVPRPWASKLGAYVVEGEAKRLETVDGKSWESIREDVYSRPIRGIEEGLSNSFEKAPKDT
jgi:hypothetical protein